MSTYTGQTPSSVPIDPRIVAFFEKFYDVSDTPSAHEDYARSFISSGDIIMASKSAAGYDGILELRKGMWAGPVKARKHTLEKIFPFGKDSKEVMLYGNVKYGLANGKDLTLDWAARAVLTEEQGELKFAFYQVYIDTVQVANAMKG